MAEKDDSQERTEEATPRRLQKARDEGQVPRSRELTTMGLMLIASGSLFFIGPGMVDGVARVMENSFTIERHQLADDFSILFSFEAVLTEGILLLVPFLLITAIVSILFPLALGGWSFSVSALAFKPAKLNPLTGLKRILGAKGAMELVKTFAKFLLVTGVALTVIWYQMDRFLMLPTLDITGALTESISLIAWSFVALCSTLILVAAIDVPFQLWDHSRQLKMTRQEIKDEFKETEGKPEVKSKIRQLQREMAQRRMMEEVPKADVIVTNPTHFSVALRYDPDTMDAPRVVAKGADETAFRIREIGREHQVMLIEAPMLARALYHFVELDDDIPEGLFVVVAQVLAYVFQIKEFRKEGGVRPKPLKADHLQVPAEYRTDAINDNDSTPDTGA